PPHSGCSTSPPRHAGSALSDQKYQPATTPPIASAVEKIATSHAKSNGSGSSKNTNSPKPPGKPNASPTKPNTTKPPIAVSTASTTSGRVINGSASSECPHATRSRASKRNVPINSHVMYSAVTTTLLRADIYSEK